jgi:uncharacterized protein YndB with AHSA1/START domain
VAVSVTVARPAAEAFDLFTAGIDRWWPRSAYSISEARTARCVLECFAGGAVYEVRDDGARFAWGQVLAFERPRRLLLSWHPGRPPEQAQEVEVRFHEEGEGTRVSLEPRVDGLYEILFNPEGEAGRRGAEDMRILAFEPPRRLAFTWNAPPDLPDVRAQRTMVVVTLEPQEDGHTRLRFAHIGWGEGGDWDRAYAYFDRAWRAVVLPRLVHRFKGGPVDWSRPPTLEPVAASLRTE